ncbi:MAG: DeoR/GlpR transcriptional regulator [Chitinophagaceae bacterium]|jgi:DeoR/GlpR family transcriptional regulator of sugar metabolism|nr:DeoR/GlpR transcriptional regulator [Chitinophagaceae bacterium]MBK7679474.1 DeoR/GlpR transcriptional regulator [Chitinophagaceae bacterium]MBK8299177.1 DeoR/GlpR transcriptional regulator [Chitinophagaceae bacterium]MBK9463228.1 DeoR/GlpR transcriptional regulator [Chitinophagaceae bacterium]MBK9659642.1 DeoR/GlpR transcriptional regulator [Chitinophagaceae bacterium]
MLKKERQAYILHQVNLHNKVLSSSLCTEINVSEDTIRRDLQELSEEGKVIKVHGGALSHSFNQVYFSTNGVYSQNQKKTIALKAIGLINNGMFVLTSGGTTIIELARSLPPQLKATFISGSIPAILEYMHHPNIEVILIGDKISKNSKITVGSEAIAKIRQVKADICFLGTNAIDLMHGITDNDWEVVQLKKAMIESSKKVVCLSIAEKINSVQPIKVCGLDEIDLLITELPVTDPVLKPYLDAGVKVA